MVFFGDGQNMLLSSGIAQNLKINQNFPDIAVFSDGERRVRLTKEVLDQDVIFLKTASITKNIDSLVVETAFMIDALKRSGAKSITGIFPHFPYGRGDHLFGEGEAVPLSVIINIFENAGLTKAVFVDPHTVKMSEMFSAKSVNVSATQLFAQKIKSLGFDPKNSVLVSPDKGGLRRVMALSDHLSGSSYISLEKKRDHRTGKIKIGTLKDVVPPNCYIIDDEIAGGGTVISAMKALRAGGAKDVFILATHAVFSGNAPQLLQKSAAKKIIVTDSIPVGPEKRFKKLEVISLASIIGKEL
mgnify:CR=1 FL=1